MKSRVEKQPQIEAHDSLPLTVERKRIRLRPTGYGLVFLAVLAAMLAGSIRYNNNLGFLLSFLLGSMVIVSCRHTRRNLEGIKLVSCGALPVFADESSEFETVADPGPLDRRAVTFGFENTEPLTEDLPAGKRAGLTLRSPPLGRGLFSPGALRVVSRYPFGLFAAGATFRPDVTGLVYPRPLSGPFDAGRQGDRSDRGKGEGATEAGADDFQGLRAYEAGDSLQLISWKTLSRGMGLYTKEFVTDGGSAVLLDWFRLAGMEEEKRLGRLCDMVLGAQRSNLPFGLRLPGETIRQGIGLAHGRRCLAELALFDPGGQTRMSQPDSGGG